MDLNATIFGQMISFMLFVWFCMKYIWPKIIHVIETRKLEINNKLLMLNNLKKKIALAKIQAINIIDTSKKKANLIIQNANKSKLEMLEDAKLHIKHKTITMIAAANAEIKLKEEKLKDELIQHVSVLSMQMAKKFIENSFKNKKNSVQVIDQLINYL